MEAVGVTTGGTGCDNQRQQFAKYVASGVTICSDSRYDSRNYWCDNKRQQEVLKDQEEKKGSRAAGGGGDEARAHCQYTLADKMLCLSYWLPPSPALPSSQLLQLAHKTAGVVQGARKTVGMVQNTQKTAGLPWKLKRPKVWSRMLKRPQVYPRMLKRPQVWL